MNHYQGLLTDIRSAQTNEALDRQLTVLRSLIKEQALSKEEIQELVAEGTRKRCFLSRLSLRSETQRSDSVSALFQKESTAEEKPSVAQAALKNAKFQGVGGVPRPNPYQLPPDEQELLSAVRAVDAESPEAFVTLERLELRYMERERSAAGKTLLVEAFGLKMRGISAAHAKRTGGDQ